MCDDRARPGLLTALEPCMTFNLKNRSFLKEIDFEPRELRFLLRLAGALKMAKYAGSEPGSSPARTSR